jgi:hypothetical protein
VIIKDHLAKDLQGSLSFARACGKMMSQKPNEVVDDTVIDEKVDVSLAHAEYASLSTEDAAFMVSFTEQERRKVVRKVCNPMET